VCGRGDGVCEHRVSMVCVIVGMVCVIEGMVCVIVRMVCARAQSAGGENKPWSFYAFLQI
jgi:hypothetical protein